MTEKRMICLSCPIGCEISVRIEGGQVVQVEGNGCPRGEKYARREAVEPMRVLPSSVRVIGGTRQLVSVKTDRPIPRRRIPEAMAEIRGTTAKAPIEIGDVVVARLLDTDANLVATRRVPLARFSSEESPREPSAKPRARGP